MSKLAGLTLQTLQSRLGREHGSGMSRSSNLNRHAFRMVWKCSCLAVAEAADKSMPPDLTAWEQELFGKAPLPKEGWTFTPCSQHRELFSDYPEEPD